MMFKRVIIIGSLVLLIVAMTAVSAFALASGPPVEDAYVYQTFPTTNYNDAYLLVRGDTMSCTQTQIVYLKWNLADVADPSRAQYAGIQLRANFVSGAVSQTQVTMYQVSDDSWSEGTVIFNGRPALGPVLDAKTITAASTVTFNAPAILDFFKQQANGDDVATVALAMTGNCSAGATTVRFDSSEPAAGGVAPTLDLRTAPPPNAVDMSGASAERVAWPLYAGLGALGVIVGLGIFMTRRKLA